MLKVGTQAPDFGAHDTDDRLVSLSQYRGRPVILYFFPKAFTPHCTIETKGFRDNYDELAQLGYEVIGVSTDSVETQCRFAEHHGVRFPMLSDKDRQISRAYDVRWLLIPLAKRVTYVLDAQHVIAAVFHHEFQASRHLDEVLRFARSRVSSGTPDRTSGERTT